MKHEPNTAAITGRLTRNTRKAAATLKGVLYPAVLILGSAFIPLNGAVAASGSASACDQSANKMFHSCRFENFEEYKATIAHCLNFSDEETRNSCEQEAGQTRREAKMDCFAQHDARHDVCELLAEDRYDPDPLTGTSLTGESIVFVDPDTIGDSYMPNPYLSLVPGKTQVLRAGEDFEETIVVHVTNEVREILGVSCRVVKDIVFLYEDGEYEPVEVTDDWFAQSTSSDIYYCGEIARNYEDGILVDLDGSFEAGRDFAKSGLLIKAAPSAGDAHRQEFLLGEAEDVIRYVDTMAIPRNKEGGENINFPCAPMGCVKTEEFIPTEPEAGEFKYYLAGTGFVLGIALEDGEITGERDELVCTGDSLDILADPACGIDDAVKLMEELCKLAPDTFCGDS
jgi:hypothetical protein